MDNNNNIYQKLVDSITPIVSIGVGSAIYTVCKKMNLNPDNLSYADLPAVKQALLAHYQQFWAFKLDSIKNALDKI
jgi:hypothetical protein